MKKNSFCFFKNNNLISLLIGIILTFIGSFIRVLPHPPNFSSIAGIALFGGTYLPRKVAVFIPLFTLLLSDSLLGFYEAPLMIAVYGSFLLCVIIGFWLKNHKTWYTVLGSSIVCSVLFFIVTNFAVWLFTPWYAKTLDGVIDCYVMALPFFRNTLKGDLFYVFLFFGSYEIIEGWARKKLPSIMNNSPLSNS